jgi:hypothetical protein
VKTLTIELDCDFKGLSYELSGDEELVVEANEQGITLYVNAASCRVLATIFGKMSVDRCKPGYHVHLKEHFGDEPAPDVLTLTRQ